MNIQQQCIVQRSLVQVIEIDAYSCPRAAGCPASHLVGKREIGIVEHFFIADEA